MSFWCRWFGHWWGEWEDSMRPMVQRRECNRARCDAFETREVPRPSDVEWSPLAWELARHAQMTGVEPCPSDDVLLVATVKLSNGDAVRGGGPTTTAAMRELAKRLDVWAGDHGEA